MKGTSTKRHSPPILVSRFTRVYFEPKNAPVMFQRAIEVLLTKVKRKFGFDYLSNVVILMQKTEMHIDHVRQFLMLRDDAGVKINLKKCEFSTNRMDYLGQLICPGCLEPGTRKIDAVRELEHPNNLTEL